MEPYHAGDRVTLYAGDCLDVLRELDDASVDAVCTDPPYGLGFMGREWDSIKAAHRPPSAAALDSPLARATTGKGPAAVVFDGLAFQQWCEQWTTECLRVLKPGGHMLAFGGTRTWHRLACAVEDAGFEIRDSIAWLYGSGFPKSLDVSKAIDKAAGAEREVVGTGKRSQNRSEGWDRPWMREQMETVGGNGMAPHDITAPATDDARTWQGWGTAMKPAHEPVVCARKPLTGTVAANVLAHGTGALNIDGCRIGDGKDRASGGGVGIAQAVEVGPVGLAHRPERPSGGRWPANVILDESQAAALDAMTGELSSGSRKAGDHALMGYMGADVAPMPEVNGDSGGASRYYYTAKAPGSERVSYYRQSCECEDACPVTASAERATGATTEPGSLSTSRSGNDITDNPSPKGIRSTTSTETSSTTTPPTSSPSLPSTTSGFTPDASSATASGGNPAPSVVSSNGSEPPTGISAARGGRSTDDADPAISPRWYQRSVCGKCGAPARRESHATVKPLDLMRWLVRLVTPPLVQTCSECGGSVASCQAAQIKCCPDCTHGRAGVVLDPFAGSGTTVEACLLEGFRCVAIEREPDYLPLIMQRINRRIDPVAAVRAAAEDVGLFDLLGEETH